MSTSSKHALAGTNEGIQDIWMESLGKRILDKEILFLPLDVKHVQ
jgi:hypothetical protein